MNTTINRNTLEVLNKAAKMVLDEVPLSNDEFLEIQASIDITDLLLQREESAFDISVPSTVKEVKIIEDNCIEWAKNPSRSVKPYVVITPAGVLILLKGNSWESLWPITEFYTNIMLEKEDA